MSLPKPTDWHISPGSPKKRCPICGMAGRHEPRREHRATIVGGKYTRRYLRRFPEIREVGPQHPRPEEDNWPQKSTLVTIARAAILFAHGEKFSEIAEQLGIDETQLTYAKGACPELWARFYNDAMERTVEVVRDKACSDRVFEDLPGYIKMADRADKWTASRGEELFPNVNGDMTLVKFYFDHYKPTRLAEASRKTLSFHRVILKKWRLITGNPPITDITAKTLSGFRDVLLASPGRKPGEPASSETVRSNMRFIQSLLDQTGPAGPGRRDAAGLIDSPPWIKPLRATFPQPKTVTQEHVSATYSACEYAERPILPDITPPDWWKALLVTAYFTGLRRGTLFSIRMDQIDWDAHVLNMPAEIMKSNRPLSLPLVDVVMEHLLAIRSDRELVFEWPHDEGGFYRYLHLLQGFAGIPVDDHFGLHTLRKTLATHLADVASVDAARFMLGHTAAGVTEQHYINKGGIIADAVTKVPVPAAFKSQGGQSS